MKKSIKFITLISLIVTVMLMLAGCSLSNNEIVNETNSSNKNNTSNTTKEDKNRNTSLLKVHYIDVGQGDSILIQVNNKNMLIDAGPSQNTDKLITYLSSLKIRRLDYVIATHPHEDHIGGMTAVIKKYDIGKFYMPNKLSNTRTFENMLTTLKQKNIKAIPAKAGLSIDLGSNANCEIIAPNSKNYESINNYSAVVKLSFGSSKFIFTGDAEKLSEREILQNNFNLSSDVIKIGHHGSASSSSKEFLNKVSPKIAVISCGKGNDYGHPHKEILTELKKRNIQVYRTDIEGNIVLTSDGKKIYKK